VAAGWRRRAARRSAGRHAAASLPAMDVVNKLADNSVLGRVLAGGLRA
jgi:hypothetical protein